MFLLKHKDGRYVAKVEAGPVYTKDIEIARVYISRQSAERDRAVNETVVELEKEKGN